jgi:sulfite oxidase
MSSYKSTNGLQWGIGAISNAEWTGVRLRDVLQDAGLAVDHPPDYARHVQFFGAEGYGASVPIRKACDRVQDAMLVRCAAVRP